MSGGTIYLVVATDLGVQVWTADGESMVSYASLSFLLSLEDDESFIRGITGDADYIAVGSSLGDIVVLNPPTSAGDLTIQHKFESSRTSITSLASSPKYLVCANEAGDVYAYLSRDGFAQACRFPGNGACCNSVVTKNETIIAAFTTGHIRIFRANITELAMEISAHIRSINALALDEHSGVFASVSEDQHVQVWAYPDFESRTTCTTELLFAHKLENRLCAGVAFMTDGKLAVSSYDDADVNIFIKEI